MIEQDIRKILADDTIPEPGETAKEKAVEASVAEFRRQQEIIQKKIKGSEKSNRLMGTLTKLLTFIGDSTMKRRYVIPSALTACLIVMVFGVSQLMESPKEAFQPVVDDQLALVEGPTPVPDRTSKPKPVQEKTVLVEESVEMEDSIRPEPMVAELKKERALAPSKTMKSAPKPMVKRKAVGMMTQGDMSSQFAGGATIPDEIVAIEDQEIGRDKFEDVEINPIKKVSEDPVSTFSIDVDTASYAFVRKSLNNGTLPPKDSVRIEELINYFDYNYALPKDKSQPFKPTVAVYPTPWNKSTKLLHIGIRGYDIVPEKQPASNLVFLLDVSGSMDAPDKLPLLKNAFKMLVNNLQPTDTVSIVVYAGAAGTVLEPTKVSNKGKILAALDRLSAGGSTAGGEGIRQAYALAEANFVKEGVNRVLLATDGDFNVGITNSEELKGFVERKRKTGIFLSVLGFGRGNYNDALMQKLAQNGNGNAAYIDSLNEARKVLVEESSSTLFTIAKDVKIQIEFNPARVSEYRLIGYETRMLKREDFNNDQVDAGDIGSGHTVTAIYEITPTGSKGKLIDDLRYSKEKSVKPEGMKKSQEYAFLKIRHKAPKSDTSTLMTTPVTGQFEVDSIDKASTEVRFAAAVAAYGQLLRQDPYTKGFTYDDVINLALTARGNDPFGLRNEFINLVRLAKSAQAMQ